MHKVFFNSLIITALLTSSLSSAFASRTAKVVLVRGKVSMLLPNARVAQQVKRGDTLPEDTSVLTEAKSIVRLKFSDKSTINLGPNSKIIISKLPEEKANMINFLTGVIKSEVNKSGKKSRNKLIIKTRSAVMGVRGTKFQATFNPANGNTTLVTVEGKVAMVKRKDIPTKMVKRTVTKPVEKLAQETAKDTAQEAVAQETVKEFSHVALTPDEEFEVLDKMLEAPEAVEVPAGRYSGVVENVPKPTIPIKFASKQYNAIAKSMGSEKKAVDVMQTTEADVAPEGFENKATGDLAQRAGGIIDFNTGIYVAPTADSQIIAETGTFETVAIGDVNEETGDYIPPKGVKLDAKEGFIIDVEEKALVASVAAKEELQATLAVLNEDVKKQQVVVNRIEAKKAKSKKAWWKPKRHILSAQISPYSEVLTAKKKSSDSESEFFTEEANKLIFTWQHVWNDKVTSHLKIGGQDYKVEEKDFTLYKDESDDGGDGYFAMGFEYKINHKWTAIVDFVDESFFYVYPGFRDGNSVIIQGNSKISYTNLGARYYLYDWKSFSLFTTGKVSLYADNTIHTDSGEEELSGFGLSGSMDMYYNWKPNLGIYASGFISRSTFEGDDIEYTKLATGTSFNFVWKL